LKYVIGISTANFDLQIGMMLQEPGNEHRQQIVANRLGCAQIEHAGLFTTGARNCDECLLREILHLSGEGQQRFPPDVNVTTPPRRSNNGTPNSSSSALICWSPLVE